MRLVVSLGEAGAPSTADVDARRRVAADLAASLTAPLIDSLVVVHAGGDAAGEPNVAGSGTDGGLGHLLDEELTKAAPHQPVATLPAQVVVDLGPSDDLPSVSPQGRHRPVGLVEMATLRRLVTAGATVVVSGAAPVSVDLGGRLRRIHATVDGDAVAALVAEAVGADLLLLATDVPAVVVDWRTRQARAVRRAGSGHLRDLVLDSDTMGAKVAAACRFVDATGHEAAIGAVHDLIDVVEGRSGTRVLGRSHPLTFYGRRPDCCATADADRVAPAASAAAAASPGGTDGHPVAVAS
ncbi:MAG: hypothetical protein HYX34_00130 [Actinobacteria bacterium]|nr:hypothetical protein [Actinomycetota bacterium]